MTRLFLILAALFVLLLGLSTFRTTQTTPSRPMVTPTVQAIIPDNWHTYKDRRFSYEISLPNEFEVSKNGDNSVLIVRKTLPHGQGSTNFAYISVVDPANSPEDGTIYNYSASDFEKFMELQIGEQKALYASDNPDMNEWFTYTRLPDRELAGKTARVITNSKPWEFPQGTTEIRYILQTENRIYLLGGYVSEETDSPYYLSDRLLKQIFDTFILL